MYGRRGGLLGRTAAREGDDEDGRFSVVGIVGVVGVVRMRDPRFGRSKTERLGCDVRESAHRDCRANVSRQDSACQYF